MAMYRKAGPVEMRPVGETAFVQGIAAQSASGQYGPTAVAAGIVSFADLTLGSAVEHVLEAHIAASRNRFRGIRHATSWHSSPDIRNAHTCRLSGLAEEGHKNRNLWLSLHVVLGVGINRHNYTRDKRKHMLPDPQRSRPYNGLDCYWHLR